MGKKTDLSITLELWEEVDYLESPLFLLQSNGKFSQGIVFVGRNANDRLMLVLEFLVDIFLVVLRIVVVFLYVLHIAIEIRLNALPLFIGLFIRFFVVKSSVDMGLVIAVQDPLIYFRARIGY